MTHQISARYCAYTLMEQFNIVVDFEVIDKRETGGNTEKVTGENGNHISL